MTWAPRRSAATGIITDSDTKHPVYRHPEWRPTRGQLLRLLEQIELAEGRRGLVQSRGLIPAVRAAYGAVAAELLGDPARYAADPDFGRPYYRGLLEELPYYLADAGYDPRKDPDGAAFRSLADICAQGVWKVGAFDDLDARQAANKAAVDEFLAAGGRAGEPSCVWSPDAESAAARARGELAESWRDCDDPWFGADQMALDLLGTAKLLLEDAVLMAGRAGAGDVGSWTPEWREILAALQARDLQRAVSLLLRDAAAAA